jgi:Uma2 family endonuclease
MDQIVTVSDRAGVKVAADFPLIEPPELMVQSARDSDDFGSRSMPIYETFADVLERLGGIDPRRVRLSPHPGKATEKDLLRLLDHSNRLYELVDGTLVEKIMGMTESMFAGDILTALNVFVKPRDLGAVAGADGTLRLLTKLVRIPDVAFFSWLQLPNHEYPTEPIPSLYPDLAVEVLSESNTAEEMERKLKEYFLAGTRLVWFVDPESRTVQVYTSPEDSVTLTEREALDGGDVLPGFTLSLKELFAQVPHKKRGGTRKRPRR